MEILTPYENGHYHFIAIIDGHAYRQTNFGSLSLVYFDKTLIARIIDGDYIDELDKTNYGWMSFEDFVSVYGELHKT